MNLHDGKEAFASIISSIGERTGIRNDIIEKDYYVVLILKELAEKQNILPAYFKGGTALYKAMKTLNRFSEDIDLTVDVKGCTNNQRKVRLENASKKYSSLKRTTDKSKELNGRSSIVAVYNYTPITAVDQNDELQRFGNVKVEATSFTISEPYEELSIEPLLFTKATENEKMILSEQFGVSSFKIKSIKQERIFVDKIIASERYYKQNKLFDVSKHLYDLVIMMNLSNINNLLLNNDEFIKMLSYTRREEKQRLGSDLCNLPFASFCLFKDITLNKELESYFDKMQNIYVLAEKDKIKFDIMTDKINMLNKILLSLDEELK